MDSLPLEPLTQGTLLAASSASAWSSSLSFQELGADRLGKGRNRVVHPGQRVAVRGPASHFCAPLRSPRLGGGVDLLKGEEHNLTAPLAVVSNDATHDGEGIPPKCRVPRLLLQVTRHRSTLLRTL